MSKTHFNNAAKKTRVSQYVLRDRIQRYFNDKHHEASILPGNQTGSIVRISHEEEKTKDGMTVLLFVTFPNLPAQSGNESFDGVTYMDIECTFKPRTPPVITFKRTDRDDVVIKDPRSMEPIREQVEEFMEGQFDRFAKRIPELQALTQAVQLFVDTRSTAAIKTPRNHPA